MVDPDDNFTGYSNPDITCRLCKLKGREETPYHIMKDCLGAWRQRRELMGSYTFEHVDLINWNPDALLGLFKHFDLENKPN